MDKIHLKSPKNWINDPNGFIYYKGKYHLFYQHFPYEPRWGTMHWGHAVSNDLVSWEHKDIALFPSKSADRNGCFSGSAVEYDGKMYIYYTGVRYLTENPEDIHTCPGDNFASSQMMLISGDGESFDNMNQKSTVVEPVEDPSIGCRSHTRDPKVWRGKNAWYMVVGSTSGEKGRLLFYRSADLVNWEYVNYALRDDLGRMWECPDYFEVDGAQVLMVSPMGISERRYHDLSVCMTVDFDEERCEMKIPDKYNMLDYGLDLYAPQSTTDAAGRRVLVAWARMPEPDDRGRNGMFCIPRIVNVKNGHIYFSPHPDIEKQFSRRIRDISAADKAGYCVSLDIKDGEHVDIGGYMIERAGQKIRADRSKVFRNHNEIRTVFETPEISGNIHLDIYVDENLIETYINNGEYVLSNIVYDLKKYVRADGDCEIYTLAGGKENEKI